MKCTNKKKLRFISTILFLSILLSGCGSSLSFDMKYKAEAEISTFNILSKEDGKRVSTFSSDLLVINEDVVTGLKSDYSEVTAGLLCNLNEKDIIFAKNVHEVVHPASITKVMTALVALQYGSLNQVLCASDNVKITSKGATTCGLKQGDTMTLDQALRILLVYSANDVAIMIAEGIAGSVENFVELMNQEARHLGATNTNFVNPHGLTEEEHTTTVYDLYLIFNEAIKYESFSEIIQMNSYQTVYYDKNGKEKKFNKPSTDKFLTEEYTEPEHVTVIGGKTGTTTAAGHCIILLVRDVRGYPYIATVMGVESTEAMYTSMINLLKEINR